MADEPEAPTPEPEPDPVEQREAERPPRDGLIRAISDCEIRADEGSNGPGTLYGYLAVFNEWSEINSIHEGHFMERLAPDAFNRTIANNQTRMKVTFNHGKDPSLGDKVLGIPTVLEPDAHGVKYEVPLFDTEYNRELAPGLKAGAYGSSFRFNVLAEDFNKKPTKSPYNPNGIPERTVREVRMQEFGPVTFPAYPNATSAMRSMTDEFLVGELLSDPGKLRDLVAFNVDGDLTPPPARGTQSAPGPASPKPPKLKPVSHKPPDIRSETKTKMTRDERRSRITELETWVRETNETYADDAMPDEVRLDWDKNNDELDQHRKVVKELETRERRVAEVAKQSENVERESMWDSPRPAQFHQINRMSEAEVFDLNTVTRTSALNPEQMHREFNDRARRALEFASFPHERADQDASKAHVEQLLKFSDATHEQYGVPEIARRILVTGSSLYRSAINKYISGKIRTPEEERAMALGAGATGGFAVVYELDPTFIRTSNLSVNPFRAIARKVTLAGTNEWRGVTSAGVVAAYGAEATEATDNTPTLAQPAVVVQKASAFVPFSIEAGQDINGLQTELAEAIQDGKDDLEAVQFTTGVGTTVFPQGILVGATTTQAAGGSGAFALADMYLLEQATPPRFRPRASLVANRFIYNKVRAFDTAGGAGMWYGYPNPLVAGLGNNVPNDGRITQSLMGYPAYEDSAMAAVLTTGSLIMVLGDFNYFVIVDRIGLDIEIAPLLFGLARGYPTGQRGLYAYWRNSSKVLSANAFRVLVTS
jgi:HK97 family phage major capsid protein/HK97 family phage prohead protease